MHRGERSGYLRVVWIPWWHRARPRQGPEIVQIPKIAGRDNIDIVCFISLPSVTAVHAGWNLYGRDNQFRVIAYDLSTGIP